MFRRELQSIGPTAAIAALLIALLWSGPTEGQEAASAVVGRVVDGATSRPVPGAEVTLTAMGGGMPNRWTRADAEGRFLFTGVRPGRYELGGRASGYAYGSLNQPLPGDPPRPLDVRTGELSSRNVLYLWQLGIIEGTVLDEAGEPAVRVGIVALPRRSIAGRVRFDAMGLRTVTDDRGVYRLPVAPGSYVLAVPGKSVAGSAPTGVPTLFFPAASSSKDAVVLDLRPGDVRSGVDLRLPPPTAARRVSGHLLGAPILGRHTVRLIPSTSEWVTEVEVRTTVSKPTGQFDFEDVHPGSYTIYVASFSERAPGSATAGESILFLPRSRNVEATTGMPTWWGQASISVGDRDVDDLRLSLRQAARVSGRLVFAGRTASPASQNQYPAFVIIVPADGQKTGDLPVARVTVDGRFETCGLPPGRYEISPWTRWWTWQDWNLSSITIGGREVAGIPIEVGVDDVRDVVMTLTDRPVAVTGTVRGTSGAPVNGATVYAFAKEAAQRHHFRWAPSRVAWARSDENGTYTIEGLLQGDYYVAAVPDGAQRLWAMPESLDALAPDAVSTRLSQGDIRVVDITLRNVR